MQYDRKRRTGRPAFTMVELVVVVAIIATLIALLIPAIIKGLSKGSQTQAKTEMGQLETGLAAARQGLAPDNPAVVLPSFVVLCENISDYFSPTPPAPLTPAILGQSLGLLTRIFGKNAMKVGNTIDWNGNGAIAPLGTFYPLTGDKALVFWLGGIPGGVSAGTPSTLGFANSVVNPGLPPGVVPQRKGPYFEFQPNRLVADGNGFLSYLDAYSTPPSGNPYVYFTSYTKGNDYQFGDCGGNPTTPAGPLPYLNGTSSFINPNGVQILCAGKDGYWGVPWTMVGATVTPLWTPANGFPAGNGGSDDQSNFSQTVLGAGQN